MQVDMHVDMQVDMHVDIQADIHARIQGEQRGIIIAADDDNCP